MSKNRHIKKLLLLAIAMLPLTAIAQDTVERKYLIIEQNEQTQAEFALADSPVITFRADSLVATCGSKELSLPLKGASYRFESRQVSTGISDIPNANPGNPSAFAFSQGRIMGLKPGARVSVYTANGMKVSELAAGTDGTVSLSLGNLPTGVYIIKTPARNIKIVNR